MSVKKTVYLFYQCFRSCLETSTYKKLVLLNLFGLFPRRSRAQVIDLRSYLESVAFRAKHDCVNNSYILLEAGEIICDRSTVTRNQR